MAPDKNKLVISEIKLVNDRLGFMGTADANPPVAIDYIPPLGDGKGYTSLELFLLSFSSCLGSAMLTFLRRMQKPVDAFSIRATGNRKENHPTGFSKITFDVSIRSGHTSEDDIRRVIKMSEDTYCPVWSMIKGNVEVDINIHLDLFAGLGVNHSGSNHRIKDVQL